MSQAELQQKVEEANNAFGAGKYEEALAHYNEAIEAAAGNSNALSILHANKGAVLQRMGRVEDSIKSLEASLENNPEHTEALYNKGVALKTLQRCGVTGGLCEDGSCSFA